MQAGDATAGAPGYGPVRVNWHTIGTESLQTARDA
jgi:hypothetical protein